MHADGIIHHGIGDDHHKRQEEKHQNPQKARGNIKPRAPLDHARASGLFPVFCILCHKAHTLTILIDIELNAALDHIHYLIHGLLSLEIGFCLLGDDAYNRSVHIWSGLRRIDQ